jgi:hypothetical protein
MHYAISRKIPGSRPDEGNQFFFHFLILPVAIGHGVYSSSNRNEYHKQKIMFLRSKVRPVSRADNLNAICEPIP